MCCDVSRALIWAVLRRRNQMGQPYNQVSQMLVNSCVPGHERAIQKETFLHVA
jgi:hypothetical protein